MEKEEEVVVQMVRGSGAERLKLLLVMRWQRQWNLYGAVVEWLTDQQGRDEIIAGTDGVLGSSL